jgi:hypothetical protein
MRFIAIATAAAFWLVPCAAPSLAHHAKAHEHEPRASASKPKKQKAKPSKPKPKKEEYLRAAPYR